METLLANKFIVHLYVRHLECLVVWRSNLVTPLFALVFVTTEYRSHWLPLAHQTSSSSNVERACVCVCACMCVCMRICSYMYICAQVHVCEYASVWMSTWVCAHAYVCVDASVFSAYMYVGPGTVDTMAWYIPFAHTLISYIPRRLHIVVTCSWNAR